MGKISSLQNKVFGRFLVTNTILFIVPVMIIFSVCYILTKNMMYEKIESLRLETVSHIKEVFEEGAQLTNVISSDLWHMTDLQRMYGKTEDELTAQDTISTLKISRLLAYHVATHSLVEDAYIHLKKSDRYITGSGVRKGKHFSSSFIQGQDLSISNEEWMAALTGYTHGKFVFLNSEKFQRNGKLFFIQSIPLLPKGGEEAVLVIQLSKSALILNDMKIEALSTGGLFVVGVDNKVLLGDTMVISPYLADLPDEHESGYVRINDMSLSYSRLDTYGLRFLALTPNSYYSKELSRIQIGVGTILIVCLLIGFTLTYYFAYHNYRPLRQLSQLIHGYNVFPEKSQKMDVYDEIRTALINTVDNRIAMEKKEERAAQESQKREWWTRLYEQNGHEGSIHAEACPFRIIPSQSPYLLLKIGILDNGFFHNGETVQPLNVMYELYTEVFQAVFDIESILDNEKLWLILKIPYEHNDSSNVVRKNVLNAQQMLRDNYSIDTYVATSSLHRTVLEAREAVQEANETAQYMELTGLDSFLTYKDLNLTGNLTGQSFLKFKEESGFLGNLISGDFLAAQELGVLILDKYLTEYVKNPYLLRCRIYGLIGGVLEAIAVLNIPDKEKILEQINPHGRLLNFENIAELKKEFKNVLDELAQFQQSNQSDLQYLFIEEVKQLVEQNYARNDLNVSFIAEALGKNLYSVSKAFKKNTGVGLLDYIHSVRVAAAKRLLIEHQELTIVQISAMAGYLSCDSFIRVFKRIEGMTPGKYREMYDENLKTQHAKGLNTGSEISASQES